jgi:DNA-binding PadR family transcriptional regulator
MSSSTKYPFFPLLASPEWRYSTLSNMSRDKHSLLGFALLGLVRQQQPCSGYDLIKIFTHTPMGTFSDSPGAIYPALGRLEESRLIQGRIDRSSAIRRRKLYRLTPKGETALKNWLGKPIERGNVIRGMGELSLRFAFMEQITGPDACIDFLESMARELASYIPTLRKHLKLQKSKMPRSASLALQSGIMGYQSQLAWAKLAIKSFRRK